MITSAHNFDSEEFKENITNEVSGLCEVLMQQVYGDLYKNIDEFRISINNRIIEKKKQRDEIIESMALLANR